jgi:uncharacterized membrane protein
MKTLNLIAWISTGIGLVLILLGIISSVFGIKIYANQAVNYFHVANSFFLITIALFVFLIKYQCKKE